MILFILALVSTLGIMLAVAPGMIAISNRDVKPVPDQRDRHSKNDELLTLETAVGCPATLRGSWWLDSRSGSNTEVKTHEELKELWGRHLSDEEGKKRIRECRAECEFNISKKRARKSSWALAKSNEFFSLDFSASIKRERHYQHESHSQTPLAFSIGAHSQ